VLGAEDKVAVQVNGATVIEWEDPGTGGRRRALQDSESNDGISMLVDTAAIFKQSLTVDSAASIGGGLTVTGGIGNNGGGITEAGAISGATSITASGAVSAASITASTVSGGEQSTMVTKVCCFPLST